MNYQLHIHKTSIWWHLVIVFAHTLVVKVPRQTEKKVPNWWKTWMTPEITFFICGRMAYICRTYLFMNYQLHILELPVAHRKKETATKCCNIKYVQILFVQEKFSPTHPPQKQKQLPNAVTFATYQYYLCIFFVSPN